MRSQYEKYLAQLVVWEDLTYFDFLSNLDFSRGPQN